MGSRHVIGNARSEFGAVVSDLDALLSMFPVGRDSFPKSDGSARAMGRGREWMIVRNIAPYIIIVLTVLA